MSRSKSIRLTLIRVPLLACLIGLYGGCVVPQPPGHGKLQHLVEPTTHTEYWLYLPEGYPEGDTGGATGKRWPLVLTFHGLNPYDTAPAQAREWQEEADRYGYIVIAPKLRTCNPVMQYPVMKVSADVARDEQGVMAIMDEVFRRTDADPNNTLSTSWSAGGYFAHFIVNRHPERFSCLSVRQSNFSAAILDPRTTRRYRDISIGVFYTENDFMACKKESEAAVEWYRRYGFNNIKTGRLKGLGHERTPGTAAQIFAESCGAEAKSPPKGLERLAVMEDRSFISRRPTIPPLPRGTAATDTTKRRRAAPPPPRRDLLYTNRNNVSRPRAVTVKPPNRSTPPPRIPPPVPQTHKVASASKSGQPASDDISPLSPDASTFTTAKTGKPKTGKSAPSRSKTKVTTIRLPKKRARSKPYPSKSKRKLASRHEPVTLASVPRPIHPIRTVPPVPPRKRTPHRTVAPLPTGPKTVPSNAKASVRVSTSIGISPLLVSFTADIPNQLKNGADFLWTDNGIPICDEITGQKVLMEPGRHRIEVLIITKDNRELRAANDVTVFERLTKKRLSKG